MANYTVTVEKYNGENFTDTVTNSRDEVPHLARVWELGEKITTKRVQFEDMQPQTYHFYEYGRIRVRRNLDQPRRR